MATLLCQSDLDDRHLENARIISQSGESLLAIINDILDFSKMEAGKLDLELVDTELANIVDGVSQLLGPRAREKNVDLLTFVDPRVPSLVRADPGRVRQIILNLVGNAIKFTAEGAVAVEVGVRRRSGRDCVVEISVTDTGLGIESGKLEDLFNRFTQADSSTTRRFGGTGLGLAICKQLVTLMNGEIEADSTPGKGSVFRVILPLEIVKEEDAKTDALVSQAMGARVLVIDDMAVNRDVFRKQIESWGGVVDSADLPQDGIRMAVDAWEADNPYDLILIDHMMPGMDGVDVGRRLYSIFGAKGGRLALTTSAGGADLQVLIRGSGISIALLKPIRPQLLLCALVGGGDERPETTPAEIVSGIPKPVGKPTSDVKILLAEDNIINQRVALAMLRTMGHRVEIANNGQEAVDMVSREHFDIVLMDIHMPEMDGLEALRRIREMPAGKGDIPVVALTANAMKGDREKYLAAGMDDYVAKPIDHLQLASVIAAQVGLELETVSPLPETAEEAQLPYSEDLVESAAALFDDFADLVANKR